MPLTKKKLAKGKTPNTKIRKDPLKEYAEVMKNQGIATISKISNDEAVCNITGRVSTKSLALDAILRNPSEPEGWAGIPLSRVTEIYGPPYIGKSTLLDCIFASVQEIGGVAILADTEVSRDRHYVKRLGVDLEKLQYLEYQKDSMYLESVVSTIYQSIEYWKNKARDVPVIIGWDALGGTATKDEWEKSTVKEKDKKAVQPGLAARIMNGVARQIPDRLSGSKIGLVILNHEYEKINTGGGYGKKKETYGGSGVRHLGSLRMQLYSSGERIKRSDGSVMGTEVVAKLIKNRLGNPLVEANIPLLHGRGFENVYTIFKDLKTANIITTGGSWSAISVDGAEYKFQGWSGLNEKCEEDDTLYPRLRGVWEKIKNADLHV